MTLKRDSIYTPSKMNISLELTGKAMIEGDYRFCISVYVSEELMRKQVLPITKGKPVVFELTFPQARSKKNVRCRAELFLNGSFVEAQERPLILWPPLTLYIGKPNETVIWVYDISGRLQKFFVDSELDFTDATFQAARDFTTILPAILNVVSSASTRGLPVMPSFWKSWSIPLRTSFPTTILLGSSNMCGSMIPLVYGI